MIIGLEVDACESGGRCIKDWEHKWPTKVQIAQWSFAAAPHHPIFDRVIQRIEANTDEYIETGKEKGVMDWTGPAVFTDVVMEIIDEKFGVKPQHFSGIRKPLSTYQAHWSSINSLGRGKSKVIVLYPY